MAEDADHPVLGGGNQTEQLVATASINRNRLLAAILTVFQNLFPRVTGSFTCAAAATTTVIQPEITSTSIVELSATNASAGTLQGSAKHLYYTLTPGASFTVHTASGGNAAGTETFSYVVYSTV